MEGNKSTSGQVEMTTSGSIVSDAQRDRITERIHWYMRYIPILLTGLYLSCGTSGSAIRVFADDNADKTLTSLLNQFINIICSAFSAVGILLAAYSVGKIALSFRNDDVDGMSRGAMSLAASIFLIVIGPIINGLGLTNQLYSTTGGN